MFRLRINFSLAGEKTKISCLQEQKEKEVVTGREMKTAPGVCKNADIYIYMVNKEKMLFRRKRCISLCCALYFQL